MMGGHRKQDPTDPEHLVKVWRGLKNLNESSNDGANHLIPIKVLSVSTQVVAGSKHRFEVLLGESTSAKGSVAAADVTQESGVLKEGGGRFVYVITLWSKPWENFEEFSFEKVRAVEPSEQF